MTFIDTRRCGIDDEVHDPHILTYAGEDFFCTGVEAVGVRPRRWSREEQELAEKSLLQKAPSPGMTQSASTGEGKSPATHQSGGVSGAEESGRGSVDAPHHRTPAASE